MKQRYSLLGLLLVGALAVASLPASAQTTITSNSVTGTVTTNDTPVTPTASDLSWSAVAKNLYNDVKGFTNIAVAPYGTYAQNVPKGASHIGGGALIIYNVNEYVGTGVGVDWMGDWTMFSGNVKFQLPVDVGTYFGNTNKTLVITPMIIAGIGTPIGSAASQSTVLTRTAAGADIKFGHLWGGRFFAGLLYDNVQGAGEYSGGQYHGFVGWKRGY
jgi:hypothetical protein